MLDGLLEDSPKDLIHPSTSDGTLYKRPLENFSNEAHLTPLHLFIMLSYLHMAAPAGHEIYMDDAHRWRAPGPGDIRSPCPALNTLAK